MNRVTINFLTCSPAPPKGYRVYWRILGAGGPLHFLGNYFSSPVSFTDDSPFPTDYEGIIVSEFNSGTCDPVHWSTVVESGGSGGSGSGSGGITGYPIEVRLDITDGGLCGAAPTVVYVASPSPVIAPGVFLFQDAALTIPVTGYLFVWDGGAGVNYNLDVSTGEVLSATGFAC